MFLELEAKIPYGRLYLGTSDLFAERLDDRMYSLVCWSP